MTRILHSGSDHQILKSENGILMDEAFNTSYIFIEDIQVAFCVDTVVTDLILG